MPNIDHSTRINRCFKGHTARPVCRLSRLEIGMVPIDVVDTVQIHHFHGTLDEIRKSMFLRPVRQCLDKLLPYLDIPVKIPREGIFHCEERRFKKSYGIVIKRVRCCARFDDDIKHLAAFGARRE